MILLCNDTNVHLTFTISQGKGVVQHCEYSQIAILLHCTKYKLQHHGCNLKWKDCNPVVFLNIVIVQSL